MPYPSQNDRDFDLLKKITTNTAELVDGGGGGGAVSSVNGQTGAVVLDPADIGAAPMFPSFSSSYILWVNKGGDDTTGDGSASAPFLTITKALSVIPVLNGGISYLINVGPGSYITGPDASLSWRSHIYMRGSTKGADSPEVGTIIITPDATSHIYAAFEFVQLGAFIVDNCNERQVDLINCRFGNNILSSGSSSPVRPIRVINCFSYSSQIVDVAADCVDFYNFFGKLHLGHAFNVDFNHRLYGCDLTALEIEQPNAAPFRTTVEIRGCHIDDISITGDRVDAYVDPTSITSAISITGTPNIVYLSPPGRLRRVTEQFDTTTNVEADIPGLSIPILGHDILSGQVRFRAVLFTTSANPGGVAANIAFTGNGETICEGFLYSGSTVVKTRSTSFGGTLASSFTVTAATIIIEGTLWINDLGGSGDLTIQFRQGTTVATPSSVLVGSYLEVLGFGS